MTHAKFKALVGSSFSFSYKVCECCGRGLFEGKEHWLEMNLYTHEYFAKPGEVKASESQGWFPFGAACAKQMLNKQKRKNK